MRLQRLRARGLLDILFADISLGICLAVALPISVFIIWSNYPLDFLLGRGAFFQTSDAAQHVTGWLFYAQDSWHYPLLRTERLNYPDGTSIAFSDSIPLAAVLFKPFAGWLPSRFHYFGFWHAFIYVSQAIAATLLVRALGARNILATVSAVVFSLTWPAMLWRLWHTGLMTQSIIIFTLALYFMGRSGALNSRTAVTALLALNIAGLMVHPYFFAFCYPVFLAFIVDQAIADEGWKRQVPRFLTSIAVVATVGAALGYFGQGGTNTGGFGYFSMNLRAPFCGGRFLQCVIEGSGGQHEGFNYFGAGLLLLIPFALVASAPRLKGLVKTYPALLTVLVLFSVYAISNAIYWGPHKVFAYPIPSFLESITGTFRGSGRFFWIVGYAILFATLARLLSRPSWRGVVLVAIALPLQWIDTKPFRDNVTMEASKPAVDDLTPWAGVLANVDRINFFPAYSCGNPNPDAYLTIQRVAAHYGKLFDTGYIARLNVDCEKNREAFDVPFAKNQLYVMPVDSLTNAGFDVPAGFLDAAKLGECAKSSTFILCQAGIAATIRKTPELQLTPVTNVVPDHARWSASDLPGIVGKIVNGHRVADRDDKQGFLTYGPYVRLPRGRYEFTIEYSSTAEQSEQAGWWDIIQSDARLLPVKVSNGLLWGSQGETVKVNGNFEIVNRNMPVEIRTYFTGGNGLRVNEIALQKLK